LVFIVPKIALYKRYKQFVQVVQELDEEKRKHEHDTAQGDDITYGLERERTRLKQVSTFDF
jgi:hypothetical protein